MWFSFFTFLCFTDFTTRLNGRHCMVAARIKIIPMRRNSIVVSDISNLKIRKEFIKNICFKNFVSESIFAILLNSIRYNPIAMPRKVCFDSAFFRFMDRDTDVGLIVDSICDFVDITHNVKLL